MQSPVFDVEFVGDLPDSERDEGWSLLAGKEGVYAG
jgi:hypothetical protein